MLRCGTGLERMLSTTGLRVAKDQRQIESMDRMRADAEQDAAVAPPRGRGAAKRLIEVANFRKTRDVPIRRRAASSAEGGTDPKKRRRSLLVVLCKSIACETSVIVTGRMNRSWQPPNE